MGRPNGVLLKNRRNPQVLALSEGLGMAHMCIRAMLGAPDGHSTTTYDARPSTVAVVHVHAHVHVHVVTSTIWPLSPTCEAPQLWADWQVNSGGLPRAFTLIANDALHQNAPSVATSASPWQLWATSAPRTCRPAARRPSCTAATIAPSRSPLVRPATTRTARRAAARCAASAWVARMPHRDRTPD